MSDLNVKIVIGAEDLASRSINQVNSALGTMSQIAGGTLIAHGLEKIASTIVDLGREALDSYADHERLGQALQSLSAQELLNTGRATDMADAMQRAGPIARDLQQWIQDLAIRSPFSEDDIAQSFRLGKAYGFTADEAKRVTQALVDFAAGSGADGAAAQRIAEALGQMYAKGKLSGEEVRQLTSAGIAVWPILSKAFGKSTAEVQKLSEQGLIPANEAIRAIVQSLEHDFGGAAEQQSHKMAGLITSLQEVKDLDLRTLFSSMFERAEPALDRFVSALSSPQFLSALESIGTKFGTVVGDMLDGLTGVQTEASGWGNTIGHELADGIIDAAVAVGQAVGFIAGTIRSLLEAHSPPKVLPDLPLWGQAAAQSWLDGFAQADAQTPIQDLADSLDAAIQSAQNQLTAIGNRYADQLDPLQAQLQSVQNQLADLDDTSKSQGLRDLLARGNLTDDQRKRAGLQLQEMGLQKSIRDLRLQQTNEELGLQKQLRDLELQRAELPKQMANAIDQAVRALQLQQQELQGNIRLAQLDAILNDDKATAAQKAAAWLEKQQILLEKQQRTAEATKLGIDLSAIDAIPITLDDINKKLGSGGVSGNLGNVGSLFDNVNGKALTFSKTWHGLQDEDVLPGDFTSSRTGLLGVLAKIKQGFEEGQTSAENFVKFLKGETGEASDLGKFLTTVNTLYTDLDKIRQWMAGTEVPAKQFWGNLRQSIQDTYDTYKMFWEYIFDHGIFGASGGGSGGGSRDFGGYASGTASASPGWHWVDEQFNPALVYFRGGEMVLTPAQQAARGGNVTVYATVNNSVDIEQLAYRISQVQRRRAG